MSKSSKIRIRDISRAAVFAALASILYLLLRFPFPFLPTFLEFNFSDVVALIGGFAFGPITGCIIQIVKVIMKLTIGGGTSTAFIGEFSDLILGIVMVLPASLIYKRHRHIKGAIIGLSASVVIHVLSAALVNNYMLIPFFIEAYGEKGILGASKMVPAIKDVGLTLILYGIIPFNLLRDLIIVVCTLLLYKRLHKVILLIESKVIKEEENDFQEEEL